MKNTLYYTFCYTAGYIDGDGCFLINKATNTNSYRANIIISSTNYEILNFFKTKFRGSIRKNPIYNKTWKVQFQWKINATKSLELISYIKNFLIERKKEANIFAKFIITKNKIFKEEFIKKMKDHRNFNKQITKEIFEDIKKVVYKGYFTKNNAAYLAGFIDAECHLGVSKYKPKNRKNYSYKIILACNNSSPNIFYWFMEKLGGCVCFLNRNKKNPKHKNQICWNLSSKKLFNILLKIQPYIRSKKEVCQKLIEFYKITLKNGGDRQSKEFKNSYKKILLKRDKIVDEIHNLNSKGLKKV